MTSPHYDEVQPGDVLPELEKGPISEVDLVKYAGASGDFNPIHTVPHVAHQMGLEGVIAHGMLIMAFAGQCLTDWAGPGALRRFKVRFSGMTRPGETLTCRAEIAGKEIRDGEGVVNGRITVKGADGSLKLKGEFVLVLPLESA